MCLVEWRLQTERVQSVGNSGRVWFGLVRCCLFFGVFFCWLGWAFFFFWCLIFFFSLWVLVVLLW